MDEWYDREAAIGSAAAEDELYWLGRYNDRRWLAQELPNGRRNTAINLVFYEMGLAIGDLHAGTS